jgi:hypothetical protein
MFSMITLKELGLIVYLGHRGAPCPVPLSGPKDFLVLHTNGIHPVQVSFCDCSAQVHRCQQLLRLRWFPATAIQPHTCATFDLLQHYHILSMQSKISGYHYYTSLSRLTDNIGISKIPVSGTILLTKSVTYYQ